MLGLPWIMRHLRNLIGIVLFARSCGIEVRGNMCMRSQLATGTCRHLPVDLIMRHAETCSVYAE